MSSRRFPGKVLAPLAGRAVVAHVLERLARALPPGRIVLATSVEASDDPLVRYVESLGFAVHRGPLDHVVRRFAGCLEAHPCDRFFRVCADSPLLDPSLVERFLPVEADVVTNVFPRTFPKGRSLELVRAEAFQRLDPDALTAEEAEHVTAAFYRRPDRFRITNLESGDPRLAETNLCVDTIDDLVRLEALVRREA